ncbi:MULTISPECIES: transcription antitermination factor NusB [unclassified Dehalobacter]|uniref:transcription antitermination factor NusB n=1 Tax=unclassified Dehalobacter TaxID=2635733 RepID=UPI000E6D4F8C|nr:MULTISPECIES: transcription antitermination factor NusB [unclassified Dehalobacter]RJE48385.1 transcription antitermination factor NusB [Dehalobacter sp. MCB1]TCX50454.1 transcription antitermination factor NusB [Dehalobacter sp. 14DCB1]TCX52306.1 transcription antitermination factor NusB [Dehalobacter sp. 12DCB1]
MSKIMGRRKARETALQILYQIDITGETDKREQVLQHWIQEFAVPDKTADFIRELVEGTLQNKADIDAKLASTSHEWALDRMGNVDRNLMRLAVYEMLYSPGTPQRVTLNEAIEIAKRFGGDDSAKFINGILDKLMDESEK